MASMGRGRGKTAKSAHGSSTPASSSLSRPSSQQQQQLLSGEDMRRLEELSIRPKQQQQQPQAVSSSASERGNRSSSGSSSSNGCMEPLPQRPDVCTIGRMIPLQANFSPMRIASDLVLYQYSVIMRKSDGEEIRNRDCCRIIFWQIVEDHPEIFGENYYKLVYDDAKALFTREPLAMDGRSFIDLDHSLAQRISSARLPSNVHYKITIKKITELKVSFKEIDKVGQITMQFLDALITQRIRCPQERIANDFYPYQQSIFLVPRPKSLAMNWVCDVGCGMEAWPGLYSAIKVCQRGLMLNSDVSTKVFYKLDMPLIDYYLSIVNEYRGPRPMNKENLAMDERQRNELKDSLKGLMLRLTYCQVYMKFENVGLPSRCQRFKMNTKTPGECVEYTVEEYFMKFKGIKLDYPGLPVIQCRPKAKSIYIPMELVNLSDRVQRVKKKLNDFQLGRLIRTNVADPPSRFERIKYFLNGLNSTDNDYFLQAFDVELENRFEKLDGRQLPSPRLELYNGFSIQVKDGVWPLENRVTDAPVRVVFGVVIVDRAIGEDDFRRSFSVFMRACMLFGMEFDEQYSDIRNLFMASWDSGSRTDLLMIIIESFKKNIKFIEPNNVKPLLVFIVPRQDPKVYATIKVACDLKQRIASQVILTKTFVKMKGRAETNAVSHNVFLKVNAKLGGVNNRVLRESLQWDKFTNHEDPVLFIGIDVTHPAPGDVRSPSIASLVGSEDIAATRYSCTLKLQNCREERIIHMVDAMRERMLSFYRQTDLKPAHIVIFRDGISNSEFMETRKEELTDLRTAMQSLAEHYEPTISYVVIQKRHHTRFQVEQEAYARGKRNVPPGTVVDQVITSPNMFDFYLCSHLGAIGTSRPAHYTVLYDTWNLSANEWQQMIYALCHLYVRCARSVSIPAPVYYAHLACKRARCYLQEILRSTSSSGSGPSSSDFIKTLEAQMDVKDETPHMYYV